MIPTFHVRTSLKCVHFSVGIASIRVWFRRVLVFISFLDLDVLDQFLREFVGCHGLRKLVFFSAILFSKVEKLKKLKTLLSKSIKCCIFEGHPSRYYIKEKEWQIFFLEQKTLDSSSKCQLFFLIWKLLKLCNSL